MKVGRGLLDFGEGVMLPVLHPFLVASPVVSQMVKRNRKATAGWRSRAL
jgi:hypothetical protein